MSRRGSGSRGRGGRSGSGGQGRSSGRNQFQRTERVGELIREIVAQELRRIDDEDLQFVTVTGVEVDRDLYRAHVFLSTLDLDETDISAIEKHSKRLRQAVAQQARIRKTPELVFAVDPGLISGVRVGEILQEQRTAEIAESDARDEADLPDDADAPGAAESSDSALVVNADSPYKSDRPSAPAKATRPKFDPYGDEDAGPDSGPADASGDEEE